MGARKTAMGTGHLSAAKRSRRGDKWPVPVASLASNEKETSETSPCLPCLPILSSEIVGGAPQYITGLAAHYATQEARNKALLNRNMELKEAVTLA